MTDGAPNSHTQKSVTAAPQVRPLLITGLSGAGRALSLKALEDVGFEAIDNPPLDQMLQTLLLLHQREGKSYLTVAIGCTSGRHRSVHAAEELTRRLAAGGCRATVRHRDVDGT